MDRMRIGELTERAGVTQRMVRYYESIKHQVSARATVITIIRKKRSPVCGRSIG